MTMKTWQILLLELSRKQKKEREKTQINKVRHEKSKVKTHNAEIQKIKRAYDEQLYGNKIDSLEEMEDS